MLILPKWIGNLPVVLATTLTTVLMMAGCGGTSSSSNATATPSFSPGGGTYTTSQTVTISDATQGAVLYCTTDGTPPTTSSPQCSQPTTVFKTEFLQAIAVAPGKSASAAASAGYTIDLNAAPTPGFSPAGAAYTSAQTVTISDALSGANIYYCVTAVGSTQTASCTPPTANSAPTAPWTLYTGQITVSSSETLSAIATATGYDNSGVAVTTYTINLTPAPTPVISPNGGAVPSGQQVTITDSATAATIYYTTNSTTPSATNGTQYSTPITVTSPETIEAVAVETGYPNSAPASASFTILPQAATPVILPAAGAIPSGQQVTIADSSSNATIYYTTNNSTPSATNGTQYTGAFTVSTAETVQAIAVGASYSPSNVATATYTILAQAATPVILPAAGAVPSGQQVTITDSSTGATIYYTTNNSTPSATNGTQYTGAITVTAAETIEAIAVGTNYSPSNVATAAYTTLPQAATPVILPAAGAVPSGQQVTITDTSSGATIYYTTNNTTPSAANGTQYTGAITVTSAETVSAIAVGTSYSPSNVATAAYTIEPLAATPSISPAAGAVPSGQQVTITDSTSGASIYYTTDNSTPSATHGTLYNASSRPPTVTTQETVQAIAIASGLSPSAVASASYTVEGQAAAPVISPNGGALGSDQTVTITDASSGAQIYYTTNGSTPSATPGSTNGTLYSSSGPFSITGTENVQAIAGGTGFTSSNVTQASFSVAAAAATPTFNPNGGAVASGSTVTITSTTGAQIYYTTNGSTPSATPGATAGTQYTAPFSITTAETVKAIAGGVGFSPSGVASASFTVAPPAETPTISPNGGSFTTSQQVTISDTSSGTTIYYTTDGTTPTYPVSGTTQTYSGAITVSSSITSPETITAIAAGGTYAASTPATATFTLYAGPSISGTVMSGSSPITGATVQLYAAGTTGYGGTGTGNLGPTAVTMTPLLPSASAVTTNASGAFALGYTCPAAPGDELYLVATTTGGGGFNGGTNTAITLMTALGSCNNSANTAKWSSVTVNEVTTIASAYALSAFATINTSGGGIDVGAPATASNCTAATQSLSPNTCNYSGLVNAFQAVNNLVNVSGATDAYGVAAGAARSITPAYANGNTVNGTFYPQAAYMNTSTVPQARINALADMLASCVESDGSSCSGGANLFVAAATNGSAPGGSVVTPIDTLQAALNIAQNPGSNGVNLTGLLDLIPAPAANPPYATTLSATAAPTDLTLALTYTGAGLGLPPTTSGQTTVGGTLYASGVGTILNTALAIDASGNIWVTALGEDQGTSPTGPYANGISLMLAGFNNQGAPLTPATTLNTTTTPNTITFGGFNPDPTLGGSNFGLSSIAIDQTGNLWVGMGLAGSFNTAYIFAIDPAISPGGANPSLVPSVSPIQIGEYSVAGLAIDNGGDIWEGGGGGLHPIAEYTSTGTPVSLSGVSSSVGPFQQNYLIFDSNYNPWIWTAADTPDPLGGTNTRADVVELNPSTGGAEFQAFPSTAGATSTLGLPTLVADGLGNVYDCADSSKHLDIFNNESGSPIWVNSTSAPTIATGRACGNQLVLDGQGHLFAISNLAFSASSHHANIDEFTEQGASISPTANGYTGTSSVEPLTLNPPEIARRTYVPGISAAIDGSGNLWVLNEDTIGFNYAAGVGGNVLVEYIGIGAPVVTPTSVALANGVMGARP